ncbi:rhomboid family intramembrane serine protease [Yoonia sp. 2307UL14-13]|uniref:rhomboid family intramembrane serine protease n=1 Tax=Yoonia sp. 2307UL14-13 TaxID=3126506 RepID=UPI0030A352EC
MLPIRDHNPSERVPYVTLTLIALNVLVFGFDMVALQTEQALSRFYYDYAMIPARVSAGENYPSLITSIFLHAGFMHLAGNMLFLWIFGDNLEDKMGHLPFLAFYLFCGIGASLAQFATEPLSVVPMVGASGAIAGVMGGYLLLFPKARVDIFIFFVVFFRIFPIPAWIMLGLWFGLQLFNGVNSSMIGGGVAYWAHAGGFVIGFIVAVPLWLRLGGTRFWDRTDGHPDHPEATYGRSSVPVVKR